MALSGTRIHSAADMVPDHRGGLPLVEQSRSPAFEHQVGIDRDHVLSTSVHIQKDLARGHLTGSNRLAAGSRTLDQNRSGRCQALFQFPVGNTAGVVLDLVPGRTLDSTVSPLHGSDSMLKCSWAGSGKLAATQGD